MGAFPRAQKEKGGSMGVNSRGLENLVRLGGVVIY
jgi:hypothetical protein